MRVLALVAATVCTICAGTAAAWPSQENPTKDEATLAQHLVAIATERIVRDKQDVRVLVGKQSVELPRFSELLVATSTASEKSLNSLTGRRVAIVKSLKEQGQWEVHANVVWSGRGELALADNIFKVKKVVASSAEAAVEVHVNGKVHSLKPGQILLVLG
jgi:hypothetical protein